MFCFHTGSMHLHDNDHDFFIGCLRNMRYSTGGDVFSFVPVLNMSDVSKGCTNKCSLQFQTKCENRGRCVNYYSHFHCDCFGTDFEGENCNIAGSCSPIYFIIFQDNLSYCLILRQQADPLQPDCCKVCH